jgi:hypothetical protein
MDRPAKKKPGNQSGSFLVRFWLEPTAGEGEHGLRGTVRNLKTGEEQHLTDPGGIGELVLEYLEDAGRDAESRRPADSHPEPPVSMP